MAYNNFYQYPYQYQQPQQIQSGGFVSVRSIEEAYNYPVAPGNSITFKDENSPYVYTKTKGFSPLEQPVFERYRLVKEEDAPRTAPIANNQPKSAPNYDEQIKSLREDMEALKRQINALEGRTDNGQQNRTNAQPVHGKSRTVHEGRSERDPD